MIEIDLLYNLFVLVALSVFSGFIDRRYSRHTTAGVLLQGILFCVIVLVGMTYPYDFSEGIIFDGRTIVISLCTLFFGPLAGLVAAIPAAIYRIYMGGGGMIMGVLTISLAYGLGCLFHYLRNSKGLVLTKKMLYLFGLCVHIGMVLLMFTLPGSRVMESFQVVALTVIVFYPIITLVMGKVLSDQEENKLVIDRLQQSENRFRRLVQNATDIIAIIDESAKIKYISPSVYSILGINDEAAVGKNILLYVHSDDKIQLSMKLVDLLARNTGLVQTEARVRHAQGGIRDMEVVAQNFTRDPSISGITVIARDVSHKKQQEKDLLQKMDELQRFHQLSLGRELNNIELKKEVNALLKQTGKPGKYIVVE